MQIKKNPKSDVGRYSLIFFQLGLIVVLLLSWYGIEKKTFEKVKDPGEVVVIEYFDLDPEDVVEVERPRTDFTPPPPPPQVPDKIQVVEDDVEIEDEIIETVEDIDIPKIEVADISKVQAAPGNSEVIEDIEEVSFQLIQDVPIFPGCEKFKNNAERKSCMSDKINQFVNRRFNTDIASDLGLTGITRINVQFTVNEHGDVVNVMARAPEPQLEDEAKRVVNLLPKMTPGKQRDKAVRVIYQLPIVFQVQ